MTRLEQKLRSALGRLGIGLGSSVIVAVSGGADSTSLLDALVRLRESEDGPNKIIAAHLNHRLRREESDLDEQFVRDLAARFNLECLVERAGVAEQAAREKKNLEATARHLRYQFLRRVAERTATEIVLTAHTLDDQSETVIMRLLRGSGTEGLRGIMPIRPLGQKVRLIRPMLDISRREVLAHCEFHRLDFRSDSSNLSIDYTRNRVRHELMPLLRTFNPRVDQTIARTARLLYQDEDYLQQVSAELLNSARRRTALAIEPLLSAHGSIRRRVLRAWLLETRGGLQRLEAAHFAALENLITHSQSGRSIELPDRSIVTREFDHLTFSRSGKNLSTSLPPVSLKAGETLKFGNFIFIWRRIVSRESTQVSSQGEPGIYLALLRDGPETENLKLRVRAPGDAYLPAGSRHKTKLKTLMIRHKIPLSERDNYPLLVTGDDQIIWSPGLPVAQPFALPPEAGRDEAGRRVLVRAEKVGQN